MITLATVIMITVLIKNPGINSLPVGPLWVTAVIADIICTAIIGLNL